MPWVEEKKLYPILALILIFIMAVRMPMDSDMWWHLRAGEESLAAGHVYRIDTFSTTRTGESWINHSWLSQVLMASLFRLGDFPALSIWVAACAVISLGFAYLQMKGHPLLRVAALILAAMVASVVWSPRPQIMSLVMLGLLSWILFSFRKQRKSAYLLSLPVIFALWGNLHGGYVLGLIYLVGFLAGEILDKGLFLDGGDGLSWKEISLVAALTVISVFAVLINPFGLDMWKIPFNTIGVETLQNLINEWSSPDFHQAFQQPFLWMLLGLLAVVGVSGKRIKGYRLVPILLFAWAALVARRNFGPFAIISAPALADQFQDMLQSWIHKARQSFSFFEQFMQGAEANKASFNVMGRNLINVTLIGLLLVATGIKTVQVNDPGLISRTEREMFPAGAVEWIQEQNQPIRIFNDYNWGGYLIYHAPEIPVFVDGRTDLYGDEILTDYLDVIFCKENWEQVLLSYDLDRILVRPDSCLKRLSTASGWKELYQDQTSLVLGK